MGRTTQELAGSADGDPMVSIDAAQAMERLRRELTALRAVRDDAELRAEKAMQAGEETHSNRLERASKLVRLRVATEDNLVEATRNRDAASRTLGLATIAAAELRTRAATAVVEARREAVTIIEMARGVATEMERRAQIDAVSLRSTAEAEVATLKAAAVTEVAEARRLRVEAQQLHDDAQQRWLAANEAMHQAASRVAETRPAVSVDGDTIWLNQDDSVDELDDRFEKYFAMELNDDSARDWMLGRRGA